MAKDRRPAGNFRAKEGVPAPAVSDLSSVNEEINSGIAAMSMQMIERIIGIDWNRPLTKQEFGKRIDKLLLYKNWRAADLERASGVKRDSLSIYINGKSFPGDVNLQKIARALGVPVDVLLPNREDKGIAGEVFKFESLPGDPDLTVIRLNKVLTTDTVMQIRDLVKNDPHDRSRGG